MTLAISVAEAQHEELRAAGDEDLLPGPRRDLHAAFSTLLAYNQRGRRSMIEAHASGSGRYDHKRRELLNVDYGGIARAGRTLGRYTSVALAQSVTYSTSAVPQLFPFAGSAFDGGVSTVQSGTAYSMTKQHLYSTESTLNLTRTTTPQGSFALNASLGYAGGPGGAEGQLARSYSLSGGYYHALTRNAKLRLDFRHRAGQYGIADDDREAVLRDLNLGIDYDRPLSKSRRTFVSFGSGSGIVEGAERGVEPNRLQVLGHAGLRHQIGRTWQGQVRYERGMHLVAGFTDPVTSDGVAASLAGTITSRIAVTATATGSTGWVGTAEADHEFLTYVGVGSLRVAVSRSLAIYGSYFYYFYDVGAQIAMRPGAQRTLERRGVQVGLIAWTPILRR